MTKLEIILNRLEIAKIHFEIRKFHTDAITVIASVPGQRWEIRVISDGEIDLEVFKSNGTLYNEKKLLQMIEKFGD